jgi:DNA repair exonuclease SbcCD ATPase subunit
VLVRSRTAYLRRYADRIQAFANYYMEQIGSSIRLVLEYQQGKLVVTTSGGYEYLSLSEGEKRRLDLCLVLAMSQVAAETGTVPASAPLIVDEAFDTLDADGVAALISLACVVAQRRQVLLISHAEPDVPKGADVWHIKL